MPKKRRDDVEWEDEPTGGGGSDEDIPTAEEVAELERESLENDRPLDDDRDDDREDRGRRRDRRDRDDDEYYDDDDDDDRPEDERDLQVRIQQLEADRQMDRRRNRGLRREISQLRARQRMRELEAPAPRGEPQDLQVPESINLKVDDAGNPIIPKEEIAKLTQSLRPKQEREPARQVQRRDVQAAAQRIQGIRDDYIAEHDDPERAEDAVREAEAMFRWMDRRFTEELRGQGPGAIIPESTDELVDYLEDTGLADDFRDRYGDDVDLEGLVNAPRSKRNFNRFMDSYLGDERPQRGSRRRQARRAQTSRRRRPRYEEDEYDDDTRPVRTSRDPVRRRDRDTQERRGLRGSRTRSMSRRGERTRDTRDRPTIARFADADPEDVLNMDAEEVARIARLADSPRTRRR